MAAKSWDSLLIPETGPVYQSEIRVAESDVSDTTHPQWIAYNPSYGIEDLFSGVSDGENFGERDADSDSVPASGDEPVETTAYRQAPIHEAFPLPGQVNTGRIPGFFEASDTRLTKPVYDYFNDAIDPPCTDGMPSVVRQIPPT